MTANQIITEITGWLRKAITIMVLVLLAAVLAKGFGIKIPVKTLSYTEMAYLAGAYWLTK